MQKKKYNPTADQPILPFRKIDGSVTENYFSTKSGLIR